MKIFGSPSRYCQGDGILDQMGEILNPFGSRFFILADETVLRLVQKRITKSLEGSRKLPVFEIFRGECSYPEILRVKSRAEESGAQVIVGIGGGKTIDTAKALNIQLNLPVVIIPTIASSDAAGTHAVVVYDENHVKLETIHMREGISFILADTGIIAQAPTRYLLAGMADAISTKFEAEACSKSGAKNLFRAMPSEIALPVGQLAYDIIREYGEEARASNDRKEVTPALEKVIEANLLLSGLGGAAGGVAAAHAIYSGFSVVEEMHHFLHGELVAFGVLAQLVLENRERSFIEDLIRFYKRVGIPARLEQLGLRETNPKKIEAAARKVCEKGSFIYNMPFPVDERMVTEAILQADSLARDVRVDSAS